MSEPATLAQQVNAVERPVEWAAYLGRGYETTDVENLSPRLRLFLSKLSVIHFQLFGLPLYVVHGQDGKHVANSRHYTGRACDIRSRDKTPVQNVTLMAVLAYLVGPFNLAIFDERARDGQPHVHIEEAD